LTIQRHPLSCQTYDILNGKRTEEGVPAGVYETFGKTRTWLSPEGVDANKADEISLTCGEQGEATSPLERVASLYERVAEAGVFRPRVHFRACHPETGGCRIDGFAKTRSRAAGNDITC